MRLETIEIDLSTVFIEITRFVSLIEYRNTLIISTNIFVVKIIQ